MIEQCIHGRTDVDIKKTNGEVIPVGHAHMAASEGFKLFSSSMDAMVGGYPSKQPDAQGRFPRILSKYTLKNTSGGDLQVLQHAARMALGNARPYCMWHQYAAVGTDCQSEFLKYPIIWMAQQYQSRETDWRDFYLHSAPKLEPKINFPMVPFHQLLPCFGMTPESFKTLLACLFEAVSSNSSYVIVLFDDRILADYELRIRQLLVYIYMLLPISMRRQVGFETWMSGRMSSDLCKLYFMSGRYARLEHGRCYIMLDSMLDVTENYMLLGQKLFHQPEGEPDSMRSRFMEFIDPWIRAICDPKRCFGELQRLNTQYWTIFEGTPQGAAALNAQDFDGLISYQQLVEGRYSVNWDEFVPFAERLLSSMGAAGDEALAAFLAKIDPRDIADSDQAGHALQTLLKTTNVTQKPLLVHKQAAKLLTAYYEVHAISLSEIDQALFMVQESLIEIHEDAWQLALDQYQGVGWPETCSRLKLAIGSLESGPCLVSPQIREAALTAACSTIPSDFAWDEAADGALTLSGRLTDPVRFLKPFIERASLTCLDVCGRIATAEDEKTLPLFQQKLLDQLTREPVTPEILTAVMEKTPFCQSVDSGAAEAVLRLSETAFEAVAGQMLHLVAALCLSGYALTASAIIRSVRFDRTDAIGALSPEQSGRMMLDAMETLCTMPAVPADLAAQTVREARFPRAFAPCLPDALCRFCELADSLPQNCLQAMAGQLENVLTEDTAPFPVLVGQMRSIASYNQNRLITLQPESVRTLMSRVEFIPDRLNQSLTGLLALMSAEQSLFADCAEARAREIVPVCGLSLALLEQWTKDKTSGEAAAFSASAAQTIQRLLLTGLRDCAADIREACTLHIIRCGEAADYEPELIQALSAGECVVHFDEFLTDSSSYSSALRRAILSSVSSGQPASSLPFIDKLAGQDDSVLPSAVEKASGLLGQMTLNDLLDCARVLSCSNLRAMLLNRIAALLTGEPGRSGRSDDELFRDYRNALVWYADQPDRQTACCTALLSMTDGTDSEDAALLLRSLRDDALASKEQPALCDALLSAAERCLRAPQTRLSADGIQAEYELYRSLNSPEHPVLTAWLRCCTASGVWQNREAYDAMSPALNDMLSDDALFAEARRCIAANLVPRLTESLKSANSKTVDRLRQFGARISDPYLQYAIVAHCIYESGQMAAVDGTIKLFQAHLWQQTDPQKKSAACLESVKWIVALFAETAGRDETADVRHFVSAAASLLVQCKIKSLPAAAQEILLTFEEAPQWQTDSTRLFLETFLESLSSEDCARHMRNSDPFLLALPEIDRKMAGLSAYRSLFVSYIAAPLKWMTDNVVQSTIDKRYFASFTVECGTWMQLPKNPFAELYNVFLDTGIQDAGLLRSGFYACCESYAALYNPNRATPMTDKTSIFNLTRATNDLLTGETDTEAQFAALLFVLALNKIQESACSPQALIDALNAQFSPSAVQTVLSDLLGRICCFATVWMRKRINDHAKLTPFFRLFAEYFLYSRHSDGLRLAGQYMIQMKDYSLLDAVEEYRAKPDYTQYSVSFAKHLCSQFGYAPAEISERMRRLAAVPNPNL